MRLLRHKGWRFYGPDGTDKDNTGADAFSSGNGSSLGKQFILMMMEI